MVCRLLVGRVLAWLRILLRLFLFALCTARDPADYQSGLLTADLLPSSRSPRFSFRTQAQTRSSEKLRSGSNGPSLQQTPYRSSLSGQQGFYNAMRRRNMP